MLFRGFENQWTPVAFAHVLKRKPISRKVAGTPLALFRDAAGVAHALVDQCPHRGVALSLGKVENGCLECPFHGWQFNGDGSCAHIPLNPMPAEKRERYAATPVPLVERGGLLWLYTGLQAEGEPPVPDAMLRNDVTRYAVSQTWKAHWTRAMENMLDSPHVPFLHRGTIGRFVKVNRDSKMEILVEETERGFRTRSPVDGKNIGNSWLEWVRPNGMTLNIPVPRALWRAHSYCVPVDDETTEMLVYSTRTFLRWIPGWIMDRSNKKILDEDRAVLESSRPAIIPRAGEEVSVATDRATLIFRRWYFQTLVDGDKGSSGGRSLRVVSG